MSRQIWNIYWAERLGADHELVPALVYVGKHADDGGAVAMDEAAVEEGFDALLAAQAAGWLAPLEHLDDGSIRTRLTIPEGV